MQLNPQQFGEEFQPTNADYSGTAFQWSTTRGDKKLGGTVRSANALGNSYGKQAAMNMKTATMTGGRSKDREDIGSITAPFRANTNQYPN